MLFRSRFRDAVRRYAQTLDGVVLPLGTVAFSVYEDRSIVGIAAYEACGSMAHELVHLAIRQNFGDSPAWLEEGLASEVAVANPGPTQFTFAASWRDAMLKKQWQLRPSVAQLLAASWASYVAREQSDVDRVAALQAMAAVFIRYLDAQHQLVPIYRAVRDSRWTAAASVTKSTEDVVQSVSGKTVAALDADFVRWFAFKPAGPTTPPAQ